MVKVFWILILNIFLIIFTLFHLIANLLSHDGLIDWIEFWVDEIKLQHKSKI